VTAADARLRELVALHFDPRWGAPWWLERARTLGLDPRAEVRSLADLARLGPMPLAELAHRPVQDFIPRRFHDRLAEFVTSETGGTTGPPRRTAFRRDEFEAAFVAPFVHAARRTGFPTGESWLFVGPSGPHAIGKAARACAVALGSIDPFSVDFDPRWARRLPADSLARRRYLAHVVEQARAVLATQDIGVIFATPPVLEALGATMDPKRRERVTGIHLGGMAIAGDLLARLAREWFPNARILSGYGNSLAGVCPQLELAGDAPLDYFPHGTRLVLGVVEPRADGRGRVRFHRLDESCFLPNVLERDEAESIAPPGDAADAGFVGCGVREPRPPESRPELRDPALY
jgi:hypothetical protein